MVLTASTSSTTGNSSASTTKRTQSTVNSDREMLLPDRFRRDQMTGCRELCGALCGCFILILVSSFIALIVLGLVVGNQHRCDTDRDSFIYNAVVSGNFAQANQPNPQVYSFGGVKAHTKEDFEFRSSGAQLNTCNGQWSNISSMPYAASNMCGVVIEHKVYLFGGFTGDMRNTTSSNSAMVYDSSTDTYTTLRPMPEQRGACGAAVLGDYIYVAGGSKGSHEEKHENLVSLSSVIRYNIKTGQWSTVQSMKVPRNSVQLVKLFGRLYAIGGEGFNTIEVYDSTADQWTLMPSSKFSNSDATVLDGKLYVLDQNRFEVYSSDPEKWKILSRPNYFQNDNFTGLLSIKDELCTMGKVSDNDGEMTNKFFCYDPATNEWSEVQEWDQVTYGMSVNDPALFVVNY